MSIIRPAITPPPDDRIRDRPRLADRQRVDALLDELAWQRHLTRTCQHVIDQLREQSQTLLQAVARLEGHNQPDLARRNHLGEP